MLVETTINQMLFLFSLMAIGYFLVKAGILESGSEGILSKLESNVFIPALVLETFLTNFTREKLASAGSLFLWSFLLELIAIGLAMICVKLTTRDRENHNFYLYGLSFSNFGFMGNAVVSALFPEIFLEYLIFTLPLWLCIYAWGVPALLIPKEAGQKGGFLKRLLNPMFLCMLLGIGAGLLGLRAPAFVASVLSSAGGCMSPVAMLLTGMVIARFPFRALLGVTSAYVVTALRLLVFPGLFAAAYVLTGRTWDSSFTLCALISLAMPLGLNTIVIPGAYGVDTRAAAGMALISHGLSVVTIPALFSLLPLLGI